MAERKEEGARRDSVQGGQIPACVCIAIFRTVYIYIHKSWEYLFMALKWLWSLYWNWCRLATLGRASCQQEHSGGNITNKFVIYVYIILHGGRGREEEEKCLILAIDAGCTTTQNHTTLQRPTLICAYWFILKSEWVVGPAACAVAVALRYPIWILGLSYWLIAWPIMEKPFFHAAAASCPTLPNMCIRYRGIIYTLDDWKWYILNWLQRNYFVILLIE